MKALKLTSIAFLLSLVFISCRKNADAPPTNKNSFYGVWVGKFGTGNNNPSSFFSFNVKEDGSIEEIDASGKAIGKGTWKFESNIFTASWQYLPPSSAKYAAVASYNKTINMLIGNWGYNGSATDGGSWQMAKK